MRLDFVKRGLHLSDRGTVGAGAGNVGAVAADFELDNSEALYLETGLTMGSTSFFVQAWVKLESEGADAFIIGEDETSDSDMFWSLRYDTSSDTFIMKVSADGAVVYEATWSEAVTTGAWYHVIGWFDLVNLTVSIVVNGGTIVTTTGVSGALNHTSSAPFNIGARGATATGGGGFLDALVEHCAIWTTDLTVALKDSLYNAGSGVALYGDNS